MSVLARLALMLATITLLPAAEVQPDQVDAIFRARDTPQTPGVALAVLRGGKIIYTRGYGQAVLESRSPITPDTSFYIGSVSKQFTAAAVALLAQQRRVSLDDDVRKYVPELPDYGSVITLRDCIHHTSGLRDYLALREMAGAPPNETFGDDYVLKLLARQKALNFTPGARYMYSNSGYFLLSLVVKRVSGQSLREFAATHIFGPLGMKSAIFRDDHRQPIRDRANGYSRVGETYRENNPNFDVVGAGGVFMTVRDFLAWDENFYTGKVGGPDWVASLQRPGQLSNGNSLTYAFGLMVGKYRGLDVVEHAGAYGGFRAHVIRFPKQHFSVVCFTNLASMEPSRLTRDVANLYLAEAFTAPAVAEATVAGAPKKAVKKKSPVRPHARQLTGRYHSPELDVSYVLESDPDKGLSLRTSTGTALPMIPIDIDSFTAGSYRVDFLSGGSGEAPRFTINSARAQGIEFVRQ